MISYLGVSVDELVISFEGAVVYTEDREGRTYSAPYSAHTKSRKLKTDKTRSPGLRSFLNADDDDWDELDDDDVPEYEVFADNEGRLHAFAESLPFAADALINFLTDYIITDEMDESWMTLDMARGALFGLRMSLPTFEEIPFVPCSYRFRVDRDPRNGMPMNITANALPMGSVSNRLERNDLFYEGVVSDDTDLDELFAAMKIPEAERFDLGEAISEGVFHLADQQCAIAFDVKKFRGDILRYAARNRMHVVPSNTH